MSYGLDASAETHERGAKRAFSTSPTLTTSSDGESSERDALMGSDALLLRLDAGRDIPVVVALIWTFASVLVQYIFHNLSFQGPFFLTYVGISLFSINLPLWYASQVLLPKAKAWLRGLPTNGKLSHSELLRRSGRHHLTLWFIANFTYNESLNLTSVSSSTIVSSTSTVFTFLLSVVALKEPFVWMKLAGVVLCMAGNISTIFNDEGADGGTDHVLGDLVALFAAFMYGVYTTAIRRLIPDEESVSISLFFGFIGIINMVCLLPIVLAFHYSSIESLSGLSFEILVLIGIKGLFDNVAADVAHGGHGGLSLTVPLAIVADFWFHGMLPTNVTLVASALVISGFVLINVGTKQNQHEYHPKRSTDRSDTAYDPRPRSNSAGGLGV
ncbi:Solute carrier family 35 member SLC35F1/F2/F6 [Phytophthora cactorum]|nr:Solute carrier family 35 member SLC35F1/F2/F6 [Phytophthora cactorum]